MILIRAGLVAALLLALPGTASAKMLCTVVADLQSGGVLSQTGDCQTRVTPASTFKIALAAMGYDHGFLRDDREPLLRIKDGDPDWGTDWDKPTDPALFMKNSVLWYSQRITDALGPQAFADYVRRFDYGNQDVSGDAGRNNGALRSWVGSSLKISPMEQTVFLRRLLTGGLPVSAEAIAKTIAIVEATEVAGWTVRGKTGSAYPRNADGSFNRARGWGWFVGWASRGDRTVVFARLDQDESRQKRPGGLRARAAFLDTWPELAETLR